MLSSAFIFDRLYQYMLLMRLHRPIGIYLLLWPTLWAVWIAGNGHPDLSIILIFSSGVILMRSAGCVINDYADKDFDPHVRRTKDRPLAARRITGRETLILFLLLGLLAFGLVLQLNWFTVQLSVIALLLAAVYPFTKRYTHLPQLFLGAAYSWSIPMAFAAQTAEIPLLAWLVFITNLLWTVAYDTMYAMVDRNDDLKIGVKSTAILFGNADRLIIALLQLIVFILLIIIGIQVGLGQLYYTGLALAALFAIYQQWLIYHRDPARCFQAFLNNHWLGMVVFLGIVADYWVTS
jgi:4-hydroxybenzoate polyprenyltransferase